MSMELSSNLSAALTYARRGWPVFPIHSVEDGHCSCGKDTCPSIGKHPRTAHGFKDASTIQTQIQDWWMRWPNANVGIATGIKSGLVVLDIDPRNRGAESLAKLIRKHGALPETAMTRTGGGGQHILFQHPGGVIKLNRLGEGIDIKADGGLIVAPPSLHASGQCYEWMPGTGSETMTVARLPEWVLEALCGPRSSGFVAKPVSEFRQVAMCGVKEGQRNIAVAQLTGHLLRKGVDSIITLHLILGWNQVHNRPPLDRDEVIRTVDAIAGRELRRRQGR